MIDSNGKNDHYQDYERSEHKGVGEFPEYENESDGVSGYDFETI